MKKIVSFFLCIVLILSFSVSAFAAETGGLICPTCGSAILVHSDTIEGIYHNIEYVCSNKECDYKRKEKKILGMESVSGATAAPIEGVTAPPAGYADDKGNADINHFGEMAIKVPAYGIWGAVGVKRNEIYNQTFTAKCTYFDHTSTSLEMSPSSYEAEHKEGVNGVSAKPSYFIKAPYTGIYKVYNPRQPNKFGTYQYVSGTSVNSDYCYLEYVNNVTTNRWSSYFKDKEYIEIFCNKGDELLCEARIRGPYDYNSMICDWISIKQPDYIVAYVNVLSDSVTNNNTITINNNTWNGNIYVDNSNKLTYIYPQYTTINENNETVTNISNNPIIYNQETNKYYTYDQTTNNYYYIYYGTPPSPSPSPDPTPSPSPDVPTKPIVPDTQNLIIPKMNANSFTDEHGTWVASGSSKYSDVFDFFYAFDRSTANFWETNVSPCHLQIEIPDPENYYIDGYIMRISKFNNRYSKDWTLQGSDDGKTWDDLDKQTGQNLSDMQEHKYTLNLRKAYKYYRLNMSNYASSMCSLSHFNLLGYDAKDVTFPTPAPTPTPDPGKPTPTPTPGGSGGGSGDTNNFWNIIIKDNNKTDKEHKGIFWALVSLLIAAITFVVNMLTAYKYLFPFLPDGVIAVINTCVAVLMIFVVIKFVMRVIK